MRLDVVTRQKTYQVIAEHGVLNQAAELIGRTRRPFLVSDPGVPQIWRDALQRQYPDAPMFLIPGGETSKCMAVYQQLLEAMLKHQVSRQDLVIALGGGVVGDLAGFAAATYQRGIAYVNIPTTSLAQIDSSIGGKTAIDLAGVKNSVGCFWQPSLVLADPETLTTLSDRQYANGLAEAVKEGLIRDAKLFELFEQDDYKAHIDEIIERSLIIKRDIVQADERESGERKLLNFGHTFGHAYESCYHLTEYYHGECVAMGMMTILDNPQIKARLAAVLQRLHLPAACDADPAEVYRLIAHDKKADHDHITVVLVDEIGKGRLAQWTMADIRRRLQL